MTVQCTSTTTPTCIITGFVRTNLRIKEITLISIILDCRDFLLENSAVATEFIMEQQPQDKILLFFTAVVFLGNKKLRPLKTTDGTQGYLSIALEKDSEFKGLLNHHLMLANERAMYKRNNARKFT